MRRDKSLLICICVFILGIALPVTAQNRPADIMPTVLEKAKADKKLLVAQNMQLTEPESQGFWPVYEDYQNELFLLRSRLVNLIRAYVDAYQAMNNGTAKGLLDEYLAIETLQLQLRSSYLPRFRAVLPEVKVLRYYQIENKIGSAVNDEIAARIPLVTGSGSSERGMPR